MRACSAETFAARLWSSQKPGAFIAASSSTSRFSSETGSKVLTDPVELGPELFELVGEWLLLFFEHGRDGTGRVTW